MKRLKKGCYNRLAAAHNLTRSSISKWPQERRVRELALLDAGATPAIANRLAELQKLCYQACVLTKTSVVLNAYMHHHFDVYQTHGDEYILLCQPELTTIENLDTAIERVKGLINEVFAVD
jgi:hypothetical protein